MSKLRSLPATPIKWPYATHLVDPDRVAGLLPPVEQVAPGALVLARVAQIGRHKDLEAVSGRRMSLFTGDCFVGVLGNRYATDQYEGRAYCSGTTGHILGIGGVCGEVTTRNNRMPDPTIVEWVGRLADAQGHALQLSDFAPPVPAPHAGPRPRTILSVGASMNSGKTTTAAQMIRALTRAGRRVAAAKITGTACRKDPSLFEDAGAVRVIDFTHFGLPSTAGMSPDALLRLAADTRSTLLGEAPDAIVYEIADGVLQRETRMLLEDPEFRATIGLVTFAGPDALSCESGVRFLRELGYRVAAVAGIVANAPLGIAEVEQATGVRCLDGESILAGALVEAAGAVRAA